MSLATIGKGVIRASIMTWRDEAALAAMALMHDAATAAMQRWDEWPAESPVRRSIGAYMKGWIVRAAMHREVAGPLQGWVADQKGALEAIAPHLRGVADTYLRAEAVSIASVQELPDHEDAPGFKWSVATAVIGFTPLRFVPSAKMQVFEASRRACMVELHHSWLDPASGRNPDSCLSQMLDMVDRTAHAAKKAVDDQ